MDLKRMFGDKYIITLDESWDAETPENRAEFKAKGEEWWYYEIKGKCGTVYPYSETQIAVVLPTRTARRLVKLMGSELTLLQHADDAMCYKADAKHTAAIVRFIKPKRLRQLTAEQRAAMVTRLARYRFKNPKPSQINRASETKPTPALPGASS